MKNKNLFNNLISIFAYAAACTIVAYEVGNKLEMRKADKLNKKHNNATRVFRGGVWRDENDNLYNCCGDMIGHLTGDWKWFDSEEEA